MFEVPLFICPDCGAKMEAGDYVLISRAKDHMIDQHDKLNVSNEDIRRRMFSRA